MKNCSECEFNYICCSPDLWNIVLTKKEAEENVHVRTNDGLYLIASKHEHCYYFDKESKRCSIYDKRPNTCKEFDCEKRIENLKDLIDRKKKIKENEQFSCAGYAVAFIYDNSKPKLASELIITDADTKKTLNLVPFVVYGNSKEEVKLKIKEHLSNDFKEENI